MRRGLWFEGVVRGCDVVRACGDERGWVCC